MHQIKNFLKILLLHLKRDKYKAFNKSRYSHYILKNILNFTVYKNYMFITLQENIRQTFIFNKIMLKVMSLSSIKVRGHNISSESHVS